MARDDDTSERNTSGSPVEGNKDPVALPLLRPHFSKPAGMAGPHHTTAGLATPVLPSLDDVKILLSELRASFRKQSWRFCAASTNWLRKPKLSSRARRILPNPRLTVCANSNGALCTCKLFSTDRDNRMCRARGKGTKRKGNVLETGIT